MFAILNSGSPCCFVPKNSPEPLSSKSFSAILKPSSVVVIVFILSLTIAELLLYFSIQYDLNSPLPTLPLNWCNCAKPNLSAFSITIMFAFGTSTPTSITVVEISMLILFSLKSCITCSLSFGFIFPCNISTL